MARTTGSTAPSYFRIGGWLVRPSECALIRGDGAVHVEPRAMDVLRVLAEANGHIVSTEELLLRCWRGTFYGDSPVHKTIAQLRAAVGDSALAPSFIATVRKRGYRIMPSVQFPEGYAARPAGPRATWPTGNPFRGLQPFALEHAAVYFGRTKAIADVLAALRRQREQGLRFVLCVGASGVGKSSLLQAGVAPELIRSGDTHGWRALACSHCSMVGVDPFDALAAALLALRPFDEALFLANEQAWLGATLRDAPNVVIDRVAARLSRYPAFIADAQGVIVIVDELEGILRHPDDAQAFATTLRALSGSPLFTVLSACRSDAYGRLGDVPELISLKGSDGHVDLSAPSIADLAEMVREPAQIAGLRFERDNDSGARLDDALRDAAFRHPECLPILSHALAQLYEQRNADDVLCFESYRTMGGLAGALAGHAEHTFSRIPPSAQGALARLLGRMVVFLDTDTIAGSQPVREALLSEPERVLGEHFVAARLFVRSLVEGVAVLRPAHDALLRHWDRAVLWIERNRALLAGRARLRNLALHWEQHDRSGDLLLASGLPLEEGRALLANDTIEIDETLRAFIVESIAQARRGQRLRRMFVLLLIVLTIGATVSGWLAARSARIAAEQRAEAERLVSFMVDDLNRSLQPLGRLDVLDGIVGAVSGYLNRTASHDDNEPSTRLRADALLQLAEIRVRQGKDAEALALAESAFARLQRVLEDDGVAPVTLKSAGNAAYWLGYLHYRARRIDAVRQAWGAYDDFTARWLARRPDDQDAVLERSYAINNLAVLDRDQGHLHAAASRFEQSIALKQRALSARPGDRMIVADLADSESWHASARSAVGELAAARASLLRAMSLVADVRAQAPLEALWTHREATLTMNLAMLEYDAGDLAAADRHLATAQARLGELQQLDPSNRDWQRDALFVRQQRAWQRIVQQDVRAGLAELDRCAEDVEALRASNRANVEWRTLASAVHERRAVAMLMLRMPQAEAAAQQALALMGPAADTAESESDRWVRLRALITLGDVLDANGKRDAAVAAWRQAASILSSRIGGERQVAPMDLLVRVHRRLGSERDASELQDHLLSLGVHRQMIDPSLNNFAENAHEQ